MKRLLTIVFILSLMIIAYVAYHVTTEAGATTLKVDCDHDGDIHDKKEVSECITPTPSCTPTSSPTSTPTPTVVPTITPTITVTPTASPSPTVIQATSQSSSSGGTGNEPGQPVCNVPISKPLLQGFKKTSPTSVFWSWWASKTQGINHQWIEYGYAKGNYPYNRTVAPDATGGETGSLDSHAKQDWARVCVQKDGCLACSEPLDP